MDWPVQRRSAGAGEDRNLLSEIGQLSHLRKHRPSAADGDRNLFGCSFSAEDALAAPAACGWRAWQPLVRDVSRQSNVDSAVRSLSPAAFMVSGPNCVIN